MFSAVLRSRAYVFVACCVFATACGAGGVGCVVGRSETPQDAAATANPSPPAPDPDAPPARPRIVALGDSLTAGYGLVETQSYPALLQKKIDSDGYAFEVINAGVSGDTSAGGLRRLDWALDGDVRVVIVAFGGNDGLRGLSVAQMKENLSAIIERAKARGISVVLAGMEAPPNYGAEYATAFRRAFTDLALQHRIVFIPFLLANVAGKNDLNQQDGIHPNAEGAAVVADTVWTVLRPMLDQISSRAPQRGQIARSGSRR